jgi:hypothetical protein
VRNRSTCAVLVEAVQQQQRCIKHMEYYHYPNYIAMAG